jgi:endonuclease-3
VVIVVNDRRLGPEPFLVEYEQLLVRFGRDFAAFGVPTLAVDTHVFRVANRIPLARGKTPREVEDGLMRIVPARYLAQAHHWLILHGRHVCKARAPLCARCVIADLCRYPDKTA